MAFDKDIVFAVWKKYRVNMESSEKWWEKCDELWKDSEFTEYLGSHYDERVVKAVEKKYGISIKRWQEHEKVLCQDFEFGSYFTRLRKLGWRKIGDIMNEPRPWRSTDSIGKPRFPDFEEKRALREVGIVPVLSR